MIARNVVMTKLILRYASFAMLFSFFLAGSFFAQRNARPTPPKSIVFAVLNDGKTLEPIAYVSRGKLQQPVNGSDELRIITAFNRTYYKPGTKYRLVFGGADVGSVSVKSSDPKADCSANMASITTTSATFTPKGLVMGLATNLNGKFGTSFRKRPSPAERSEIEALVSAEIAKHKFSGKNLKYHNLTSIDVDNDGIAEMVGTYWIDIDPKTRGLFFFIAEKGNNPKYALAVKDFRTIDEANVMSGDIKSIDEGVYHELLLDLLDVDGDGVREVFTYVQSFEGAGFTAYSRKQGKWAKAYEWSNYHCGF
jgi:hypothetical protein